MKERLSLDQAIRVNPWDNFVGKHISTLFTYLPSTDASRRLCIITLHQEPAKHTQLINSPQFTVWFSHIIQYYLQKRLYESIYAAAAKALIQAASL